MKSTYQFLIAKFILTAVLIAITGCRPKMMPSTPAPEMEVEVWPTPASTLQELISNISNGDDATKIVSIYALEKYGDEASPAIPTLIERLRDRDSDVKIAAIYILGKLGSRAKSAIPSLTYILENEQSHHSRERAATALGDIDDPSAIPALAKCLTDINVEWDGYGIQISCAKSIAIITGEKFTDSNSLIYTLDSNGIPLIVKDAQNWWIEEGQFINWEN